MDCRHRFLPDDSLAFADHDQPVRGNILEIIWELPPIHRTVTFTLCGLAETEMEPGIINGIITRLRRYFLRLLFAAVKDSDPRADRTAIAF